MQLSKESSQYTKSCYAGVVEPFWRERNCQLPQSKFAKNISQGLLVILCSGWLTFWYVDFLDDDHFTYYHFI